MRNFLIPMRGASQLVLVLLFASCANFGPQKNKKAEQNKQVSKGETAEKVEKIAEATSRSSIKGSSQITEEKRHHHKTYYLFGAQQLNLKNYYFDIPVVYNAQVKKWMKYFLTKGRPYFERYAARAGRYAPLMGKILENLGMPRDLIFLAMAESGFRNDAISWATAVGPWQFMSFTGRRFGLKINWHLDERRDPFKATVAAAHLLKALYNMFGSWELAAAAYNAGEGKIKRAIRRYGTESFWRICRGRYLKSETKNYVPKIMALAIIGKNLSSFGFKNIDFFRPLDFEEIDVPAKTDLYKVASQLDIKIDELKYLNPELLRWYVPDYLSTYKLRVPLGKKQVWASCCQSNAAQYIADGEFQSYRVKGRRTRVRDVARKFKIKPQVLAKLNGTTSKKRLKKGQWVVLPFRKGQSKRHPMYADLYKRPRRSVVRRRKYRRRIRLARRRGRRITSPKVFHTVRKGESLWKVARKYRISLDTLILSNMGIIKRRMIRAGDRLVVR